MKVQINLETGMEDDGCVYPIKFLKIDEKDGLYDGGIIWELDTGNSWERKYIDNSLVKALIDF